jgi:glycosyltransferase involved in cell wall biosynthesis
MMLTWSLIVCTYKRGHVLPRCLRCAVNSGRKPCQVIVVDASPDWEGTRDAVLGEFREIELVYVQARRASLTAQRNQGLEVARGDVAFLIDDDSLLYPDAAEKVMEVYEADVKGEVVAITPVFVAEAPDVQGGASGGRAAFDESSAGVLRRITRRVLWSDLQLLPYDGRSEVRAVPEHLRGFGLIPTRFSGGSATFRTGVVRGAGFEEMLERYAAGEDWDISERIREKGLIAFLPSARQCHLEASGGRLSKRTVSTLRYLNFMALHVVHSRDVARSRRMYRRMMWRRVVSEALSDLTKGQWRLPRAGGAWAALRRLGEMFEKRPEEMRRWYPELQRRIIEQDRGEDGAR